MQHIVPVIDTAIKERPELVCTEIDAIAFTQSPG
ncbi:hypothetical protein [Ferruginibacter sp.]